MQPGPHYPPPARFPRALMAAIVVLTLLVTAAGLLTVPKPELSQTSPWLVAGVPAVLWMLVLCTTAVCGVVAAVVTVRATNVRWREPALLAWLLLVLLSAAALIWNALYSAALSSAVVGAIIPIFHWLYTLVPAVLAGAIFRHRGRPARWAAAAGTGVVTLPLFHLSSVLLLGGDVGTSVLGALWFTGVLGVAPLIGGVALAGALGGRDRTGQLPYPYAG